MHFDEAALTVDHQAGADLRHHLADLLALYLAEGAGDALGALEQEEFFAVMRGPRAGGWVAAADQVEGLVDMGGPVDPGFGLTDDAFVPAFGSYWR